MPSLEPFRTASTIRWVRHTTFAPHRGDDGNLVTDQGHSIPLDTYPPDTLTGCRAPTPPMTDDVGIVVVDPSTLADVHTAVTAWCRDNLGRDDVTFAS